MSPRRAGSRPHRGRGEGGSEAHRGLQLGEGGSEPASPTTGEGPGGRLFVVATPIGNLADVTLRALDVLGSVPLLAAEDTRLSRRLLDRHGIRTRLISYHADSPPSRTAALLAHLRTGKDLALVTDAGTPGVSDPGEALVAAWAAEGGTVVAVPGPSAVTAAVAASGVTGPRWSFEGFLPRAGAERRRRLARIAGDDRATILFEAPARLAATLDDLTTACGADRPAALCRELTKLHEQVVRGSLGWLAAEVRAGRIPARGEVVVVVGAEAQLGGDSRLSSDDRRTPAAEGEAKRLPAERLPDAELVSARAAVERLVAGGIARGEAARRVAAETGLPRRQLYGRGG